MSRWVSFWVCAVPGLAALAVGLVVPAHLRARDAGVAARAGANTPSLVSRGLTLVDQMKLGPAQLLGEAARQQGIPDANKLQSATASLAKQSPMLQLWGAPEPSLERIFNASPRTRIEPLTDFLIRGQNCATAMEALRPSTKPAVQELLHCRSLTKTVLFPPSNSASGQAFDAALGIVGLLTDLDRLAKPLSDALFKVAWNANHGGASQPLEETLLDFMSLGQRLNWGQLTALAGKIEDLETLRWMAHFLRREDRRLPTLFAAVELSGKPALVVRYLTRLSQTGLQDLEASLRFGSGGVDELLQSGLRLSDSKLDRAGDWMSSFAWRLPVAALALKWTLYLLAGFLLAAAMHFARRPASALERPLQVRGFHVAREILFALGFLLVVLLLSEPFLAQESQKVDFPFRLTLPTVGGAVPARITQANPTLMNQLSLLTLLLFFVLQALIYTACLFKLAEIRRQQMPPRIKLKLLENEDHLFDAGLYLGFVGTIISLIMVSLGIIKPSLMAAYSSTSFGIIFVSIFKIFHLRPVRRRLLLESESAAPEIATSASPRSLAAAS